MEIEIAGIKKKKNFCGTQISGVSPKEGMACCHEKMVQSVPLAEGLKKMRYKVYLMTCKETCHNSGMISKIKFYLLG